MNKINSLFANSKDRKLLSLYFCAGAPTLDSTADTILTMQAKGISMIEVGIPFSDPMADGPVIQEAATTALKNGMSLRLLFQQLKAIKEQVHIPLVLMGYLNPIMQYGIDAFCQSCVESGVSGVIIPDLPFDDYLESVKPAADKYGAYRRLYLYGLVGCHHGCPAIVRRTEATVLPSHQCNEPAQSSYDWLWHL